MSAHDRYLQRALVLAKQNIADGGRPFGAVLVRNDEIVAESVNTFHLSGDPTAHAELNAVRDLAARLGSAVLRECVIYASGQPCPMCLSALYLTGVREVFSPIAIRTGSLSALDRRDLSAAAAAAGPANAADPSSPAAGGN